MVNVNNLSRAPSSVNELVVRDGEEGQAVKEFNKLKKAIDRSRENLSTRLKIVKLINGVSDLFVISGELQGNLSDADRKDLMKRTQNAGRCLIALSQHQGDKTNPEIEKVTDLYLKISEKLLPKI